MIFNNKINFIQYNLPSSRVFPIPLPCPSIFPSVRSVGFPRPLTFSVSKDVIELIGIVEECFPNATFRVRVTSEQALGHTLLCHLAGRMRVNRVRILPGDKVKIEMTPYDLNKGRIVYRFSAQHPAPGPASTSAITGTSPSPPTDGRSGSTPLTTGSTPIQTSAPAASPPPPSAP